MNADRVETEVDGRSVVLSHLDKVLFPDGGFTKGEMLDYYARVAPVMLPHLEGRQATLRRAPDGARGQAFYEKHAPAHRPEWVETVTVEGDAARSGTIEYLVVSDRATLLWAANLGAIEFHVPGWRRGRDLPGRPDYVVFDLDPGPDASVVECCEVALALVDRVGSIGRGDPVVKTSGSKGLQLYVSARPRATWDGARDGARAIATALAAERPDLVVSNMRRALRAGKVLIDWSQNTAQKTTVAAYSLRIRDAPSPSAPVTLDEVAACARSGDAARLRFTPADVLLRVERSGDLFARSE